VSRGELRTNGGRPSRRLSVAGALVAAAVVLASLWLDGRPAEVPELQAAAAPSPCLPTGFLSANGEPVPSLEQVRMNSNSFLRALVCEPSVLSLAAEGTAARGVGARLSVHLGSEPLFDDPVDGTVTLSLPVERPGWLVIAFNNDLYEPPQDRNLVLRDVRLEPLSAETP